VTILISLILHIIYIVPIDSPCTKSLVTPLKQLQEVFLVLFYRGMWSPPAIYHSLILVSTPPYYTPLCTHCDCSIALVLIINIWVDIESGVSVHVILGVLQLGLFNSFNTLPYVFTSTTNFSVAFNTHPYISTFTSYGMLYFWCSIILFTFITFHEFHRVVLLLQTCSTTEFVYNHVWFGVYVYLWIYLPDMRETVCLVFLILANFT
jgi:hypothetical protein